MQWSVAIGLGVDNIWENSPLVNTETTSLNGFRDRTAVFQESVAQVNAAVSSAPVDEDGFTIVDRLPNIGAVTSKLRDTNLDRVVLVRKGTR